MLETHSKHEDESWASQTRIYNAEANQCGWFHEVKAGSFRAKCQRFELDGQFAEPGVGRRWIRYEDQVLKSLPVGNYLPATHEAFIAHMKATFDSEYYRSFGAVAWMLRVLYGEMDGAGDEQGVWRVGQESLVEAMHPSRVDCEAAPTLRGGNDNDTVAVKDATARQSDPASPTTPPKASRRATRSSLNAY